MELWNLYDEKKNIIKGHKIEKNHKDGIPRGMYHMAVWLFIITKDAIRSAHR